MNATRKSLWTLSAIAALFIGTAQLSAISQVTLRTYNSGSGGNFRADPNAGFEHVLDNYVQGKSTDGTWFGTFCIEFNEYFRPGHTYDVALNNGAIMGGVSGAVNGKDVISIGTAWLYEKFVLGTLQGFTYGNQTHAKQLQNTIWHLEGELNDTSETGTFLGLATSLSNYDLDYTGSAVQVMNLTKNNGTSHHQDQLVYMGKPVPDAGSTLAFFGIAFAGLIALKRRQRR